MICPKCQTQNPEDAKFCLSCGSSLGTQSPPTEVSSPIPPPSLWIKRILIILFFFNLVLTLFPPLVYFLCYFSGNPNSFFCQGLKESFAPDMKYSSLSLEEAVFIGFLKYTIISLATLIILWGLKRRKMWFLKGAFIYTFVFLIDSLSTSVFFVDIVLAVVLLLLLLRDKEKLQFKK